MAVASTTAAIISATVALAGAAAGAYGAIQQSQTARQQQEYQSKLAQRQAQIAEQNAQVQEEQARQNRRDGYEAAVQKRQEAARIIGQQRAAAGASGSQVDAGSALDVNLDTAEKGELDAFSQREQGLRAAHNNELSAWSARNSAQSSALQAEYHQQQAATDYLGLTQSLLGSAQKAGRNFQLLTGRGPTLG